MKKIIKGKIYDTATAKHIWENGYKSTDFNYWYETLYQKRTGEFFLHCIGGANSRYGHWKEGQGSAGEEIKPLSYVQAKAWAEENLMDDERYKTIFGIIEEDGSKEYMTISLSTAVAAQLRRMSAQKCKSVGEIIAELINKEN